MSSFNFERIVCINLAKRTDRWRRCTETFADLGWTVLRQEPIVHADAEVSLKLTTAAVLAQALADRLDHVLILEDDVQFYRPEKYVAPPADYELYYLGTCLHQYNITKVELTPPWLRLLSNAHCSHAILYRHTSFARVIDGFRNTTRPLDGWLGDVMQPEGHVYCTNPMIAVQYDSVSDISPRDPFRCAMHDVLIRNWNAVAGAVGAQLLEL